MPPENLKAVNFLKDITAKFNFKYFSIKFIGGSCENIVGVKRVYLGGTILRRLVLVRFANVQNSKRFSKNITSNKQTKFIFRSSDHNF